MSPTNFVKSFRIFRPLPGKGAHLPCRTDDAHGFVLVLVLWAMLLIGMLATFTLRLSSDHAIIVHNAVLQAQMRAAVAAGVSLFLAQALDPHSAAGWPIDGSPQQISYHDTALTIRVYDELGRIDINGCPADTLRRLFVAAGQTDDQAQKIAQAVIEWRVPPVANSGTPSDTHDEIGYHPRGGPFEAVDELRLVTGMAPDLYRIVRSSLTVYASSCHLDLTTASPLVRQALLNLPPERASPDPSTRPTLASVPDLAGRAFTVLVSARSPGGAKSSLETTIRFLNNRKKPFWTLAWQQADWFDSQDLELRP